MSIFKVGRTGVITRRNVGERLLWPLAVEAIY